jgi:2-polyprenyl-3-methyl-5-hydroxy-6-metoxy-1,4-benzoquinol methylase
MFLFYKVVSLEKFIETTLKIFPKGIAHEAKEEAEFWNFYWKDRIDYISKKGIPWEFNGKWQNNLYFKQLQAFNALSGDVKNKKILEAGSGSGLISIQQVERGAEVYLTDITTSSLNYAKAIHSYLKIENPIHPYCSDSFNLCFDDNSFDIVWNNGVIEHYDNPDKMISEMKRVVKPNGKIILAVPNLLNPEMLYITFKRGRGTERYYTQSSLKNLMLFSNLDDVKSKSACSVIPSFLPEWTQNYLRKYENKFPSLGLLFYVSGTVLK